MTRFDGMAFPAADIRESDHGPRVASTVPKTVFKTETTRLAVNGQSAASDSVNSIDSGVRA